MMKSKRGNDIFQWFDDSKYKKTRNVQDFCEQCKPSLDVKHLQVNDTIHKMSVQLSTKF